MSISSLDYIFKALCSAAKNTPSFPVTLIEFGSAKEQE